MYWFIRGPAAMRLMFASRNLTSNVRSAASVAYIAPVAGVSVALTAYDSDTISKPSSGNSIFISFVLAKRRSGAIGIQWLKYGHQLNASARNLTPATRPGPHCK